MMAKEPADRYRDCKELLDDLELVRDGKEPQSQAIDAGKSSVAMARVARPKRPAGGAPAPHRTAGSARTGAPVGQYLAISVAALGALIFVVALSMSGNRDGDERAAERQLITEKKQTTTEKVDTTPPQSNTQVVQSNVPSAVKTDNTEKKQPGTGSDGKLPPSEPVAPNNPVQAANASTSTRCSCRSLRILCALCG